MLSCNLLLFFLIFWCITIKANVGTPFLRGNPFLCVSLSFLQMRTSGIHFKWIFQVFEKSGGAEEHFLPLGTCTHVTLVGANQFKNIFMELPLFNMKQIVHAISFFPNVVVWDHNNP